MFYQLTAGTSTFKDAETFDSCSEDASGAEVCEHPWLRAVGKQRG